MPNYNQSIFGSPNATAAGSGSVAPGMGGSLAGDTIENDATGNANYLQRLRPLNNFAFPSSLNGYKPFSPFSGSDTQNQYAPQFSSVSHNPNLSYFGQNTMQQGGGMQFPPNGIPPRRMTYRRLPIYQFYQR